MDNSRQEYKKYENKQETSKLDKIISLQHTKIEQYTIIDKNKQEHIPTAYWDRSIDKNKQEYIPTAYWDRSIDNNRQEYIPAAYWDRSIDNNRQE